MNLNNIQKLIKNVAGLSPREKAILELWSRVRGSTGDSFIKYHSDSSHIFTSEEEKTLTEFDSRSDEYEFIYWHSLIGKTLYIDQYGESKYMAFLLTLIDIKNYLSKTEENIIVNCHHYNKKEFCDHLSELYIPLTNYFTFYSTCIVGVLVHQYCLSGAFDEKGDLLILDRLATFLSQFEEIKSTFAKKILHQTYLCFLEKLQKDVDYIIDSYAPFIGENYPPTNCYFLDDHQGVKEYVKKTLNQYLPGLFDLSVKPQPLFK